MAIHSSIRPVRRPVVLANYATSNVTEAEVVSLPSAALSVGGKGIRQNFPAAGESVEGGTSDGYRYRVSFAAGRLEATYAMVRAFLEEHGYGDIPLPKDAAELRLFRLPPKLRHQLSLFGDNGYVHNPVRILFPVPAGRQGALLLELFNEADPDHLVRFHRAK